MYSKGYLNELWAEVKGAEEIWEDLKGEARQCPPHADQTHKLFQ